MAYAYGVMHQQVSEVNMEQWSSAGMPVGTYGLGLLAEYDNGFRIAHPVCDMSSHCLSYFKHNPQITPQGHTLQALLVGTHIGQVYRMRILFFYSFIPETSFGKHLLCPLGTPRARRTPTN